MAEEHLHVDVVVDVVARRIVGDLVALGILALDLGLRLAHLGVAPRHLIERDEVGVLVAPVGRARQHQSAAVLVEVDLLESAIDGGGGGKRCEVAFVLLAVGQLLTNVLDGGAATPREEGRELAVAVLAEVAVRELGLAEHAQLFATDGAVLLLEHLSKQSHGDTSFHLPRDVHSSCIVFHMCLQKHQSDGCNSTSGNCHTVRV